MSVKLSQADLVVFKPTNNMVLLKPILDTSKITIGDLEIEIDNSWHPENHVSVINEVVAVPDGISFSPDPNKHRDMEWECDMQLKVGDKVWINYLAGLKGTTIEVGEEKYLLIHYSKIYLTVRDEFRNSIKKYVQKTIMLNGYVLIEPYLEEQDSALVDGPKENKRLGTVKFLGRPNRKYKYPGIYDDPYLREQDLVVLKNEFNKTLESDVHASFDGGKKYYVTQRSKILGVLNKNVTFKEIKSDFWVKG